MAKIKGLWKFKTREYTGCDFDENVNFTINGYQIGFYTRIYCSYFSSISGKGYSISAVFGEAGVAIGNYVNSEFYSYAYDYGLDFGYVEQEVSDTFYNWMVAHATQEASAYAEGATTTATYKFDTQSESHFLYVGCTWGEDAEGPYYYAVIPLELGKSYTVTLQGVTDLPKFRGITTNTDTIGSASPIRNNVYNGAVTNGLTLKFIADVGENYLLCYGGTANGGELLVTCTSDEEPTSTVITYNGSTIATLEAGQTATIKTAETEVEHDIIITPVFPINIAYGDIIATANEGQIATIKCANTEADFDIVVSAKAEEDVTLEGTWMLNETLATPPVMDVTVTGSAYMYDTATSVAISTLKKIIHRGNGWLVMQATGDSDPSVQYVTAKTSAYTWYARANSKEYNVYFNIDKTSEYYDEVRTFTIDSVTSGDSDLLLEYLKANAKKIA